MGVNTSTNMNLPVPQVGAESGPQYAQDINNCLTLVDQHNHSPGYGVQIGPNGLNINADLPMNTNNLTTARSVRFTAQSAVLNGASDVGCLYEVTNDLYYNDGLGNQVRLTQSGAVAGTSGSISNLVSPASAAYVSGSTSFVWQSNTNVAANLDARNIILRTSSANSHGLTLGPPGSISGDYSIALPLLPASTLPVFMDSSGNMSTSLITTAVITNANVTRPKLVAVGQQISSSCGSFVTSPPSSPVDVTNLTVTLTTTGRPVMVFCQSDGTASTANFSVTNGEICQIYLVRDGSAISITGNDAVLTLPPSTLMYLDTPTAGTHAYKVQVGSYDGATVSFSNMVLVAYEL